MKKTIALLALVSFAVGLNATLTKEELYKVNPTQFKQLKQELSTLNTNQTEQQKQAFINKQITEAVKAVLLNKEILKNSNYALVKNGQIIKTGKAADAQGVYFWHEFSSDLENPPAENTCVINNGTWEEGYANSTCGMIKYRMDSNSPFASVTEQLNVPGLYLLPDLEFTDVENIIPNDIVYQEGQSALAALAINISSDPSANPAREVEFESFQTVTDSPAAIGYINPSYTDTLVKPILPWHKFYDMDKFTTYYKDTENVNAGGNTLYTLKSGNYLQLLVLTYNVSEYWWDGQYIFFKWFKLKVENNYLDVAVDDYTLNNAAKITWNNNLINIELEDSINPAQTTYELYDISGKMIQRRNLNSNNTTIYVPSVSNGIYFVRLLGKNLNLSKKIVIKK